MCFLTEEHTKASIIILYTINEKTRWGGAEVTEFDKNLILYLIFDINIRV